MFVIWNNSMPYELYYNKWFVYVVFLCKATIILLGKFNSLNLVPKLQLLLLF